MGVSGALCHVIFFSAICNQVTGWTIDLPEVRRYYFERFSHGPDEAKITVADEEKDGRRFDNINADSPHNKHEENYYYNLHKDHGSEKIDLNVYANAYNNYESYMKRKVQDALHNGTAYLDGLRRSIERYMQLLENCTRLNYTSDLPPELTSPLTIGSFSGVRGYSTTCREVSEGSERVRRLAELALHTARRLQDVAYTAKYNKDDGLEENELLLRLAWYLDKLASLTGYDPDPHAHTTPIPTREAETPSPSIPFLPEVSPETMAAILRCLRDNSSEPATERCAYRVPQTALRQIVSRFNISESTFRFDVPLPTRVSRQSNDDISPRSSDTSFLEPEMLIATDNKNFPPNSAVNVKTVRKRSVTDSVNPLVKVLKYYAKHKVWSNSNPISQNSEGPVQTIESFDVKNGLHSINKRSVVSTSTINKIPEDPMQDLSKYIKSKANIHYVANKIAADRLRAALENIRSKKLVATNKIKSLTKLLRTKRNLPVEHVRETIKTATDIHYDIPKDLTEKLKAAIHHIPVALSHIPVDLHHHSHHGHIDHLAHHGHLEHVTKNIKADFHYDNLHKEEAGEKIKAAIHHIHSKKVQIQKKIETLRKIFRPKRSIHYEGVVKPRISEDPQQDLSYYSKNKPGTNARSDLAQAAMLRSSLEAVFQRGNINVVHKYGSNYNPLVVAPFYFGILRSFDV